MANQIAAEWVREVITEQVDSAFELLVPGALLYGGAVRDVLAGYDVQGDLDIVAPPDVYPALVKSFRSSVKWCSQETKDEKKKKGYEDPRLKIDKILNIVNHYGVKAQLIRATKSAYALVSSVDIRCCGVALTHAGHVVEVLDGAYEDCLKRRLIATDIEQDLGTLQERIEKLTDRGWTSCIDLDEMKNVTSKPS